MPADIKAHANELLREIGRLDHVLGEHEAEYRAQIEDLERIYASLLKPMRDRHRAAHDELVALMRGHRTLLFADASRVSLERGDLIHEESPAVTIPRDAVERCEEYGLIDALKIAKSIDRGVVATWPDDRLALIGASRKTKHTYSYEVS